MKNLIQKAMGIFVPKNKLTLNKRCKYIIVDHPQFAGLELPILFPEALQHHDVAKGFNVISAGFYDPIRGANGCSVSLQVNSHPQKDNIIIGLMAGKENCNG